jgi:hypothetical protein
LCCGALENLANNDTDSKVKIGAGGGVEAIVTAPRVDSPSTSPISGSAGGFLWWHSTAPRVGSPIKILLARQLLVVLNEIIPRNDAGHWEILGKPWLVPTEQQLTQLSETELRQDILAAAVECNRRQAQLMSESTVQRGAAASL